MDVLFSTGVLIGLFLARLNPVIDNITTLLIGLYILYEAVHLGKEISDLEYVVVQIKGKGRRSRVLRGECAEVLERIGPEKKGKRVITPYKDGKVYDDFGAPEYLVADYDKESKEVMREIIVNPYYRIGRGHGVRFARAIQADEVRTENIGENAKQALGNLNIRLQSTPGVDRN